MLRKKGYSLDDLQAKTASIENKDDLAVHICALHMMTSSMLSFRNKEVHSQSLEEIEDEIDRRDEVIMGHWVRKAGSFVKTFDTPLDLTDALSIMKGSCLPISWDETITDNTTELRLSFAAHRTLSSLMEGRVSEIG